MMFDERDAYLDAIWRPFPAFIGPVMPPMIAWLKRGGPFHPGGPYPGSINYPKVGGQFAFEFADGARA